VVHSDASKPAGKKESGPVGGVGHVLLPSKGHKGEDLLGDTSLKRKKEVENTGKCQSRSTTFFINQNYVEKTPTSEGSG